MKLFIPITSILLITGSCFSQSLNLRFNTSVYAWQRQDSLSPDASKTTHIRSYQNLLLDVSTKSKVGVNVLFQSEGDLANRIGKGFNYRFYNAYIKGGDVMGALDFRLGRSYVFAGVGKGSVDGAYLKIKAGKKKEFQLAGYAGYYSPYDYQFSNYGKLKENYIAGGQFSYYGVKDLFVGVSYMNRHRKPTPYYALRLDTAFNTKEVLVDIDSPAEQFAGLDFNYSFKNLHNFFGKAYYDINLKKIYRVEVNVRGTVMDNLRVYAGYLYRQPQLAYNTIFWVFEHRQNQEIEGGVDYNFKKNIVVFGRAAAVLYEGDNSIRVQAGFNSPSYGLSYTRYFGYAGESDGVSGYYYRQIVPEKLSAAVSADFSRYRLGDYDTEKITSLSGMLGITYRPVREFSIDVQGQFIKNRIYNFDTRGLVTISYWLFKKL